MTFTLPFETPSKKNSRIVNRRTGRSFPSRQYTEWHGKALACLLTQGIKQIEGEVQVSLVFTHGTLRRRDADNQTSSILDLLVDAGVIVDDSWKVVRKIVVENSYKKGEDSCNICISELY